MLDGLPVSRSDRVVACQRMMKNDTERVDRFVWWHVLRSYVGVDCTMLETWLYGLEHLILRDRSLYRIPSLESLPGLTYLDLSGNPMQEIPGLECLFSLRHLNLSGCPHLQIDLIIQQLQRLKRVEWLALCMTGPHHSYQHHPRAPSQASYREQILQALLPFHENLQYLDGVRLSIPLPSGTWSMTREGRIL